MRALSSLWRLTVGKKIIMAATGAGLCAFVLGHMAGNLKIFLGREVFNHYAEWLRHIGEPLLPPTAGLCVARLGIIACAALHITMAVQLYLLSDAARPTRYNKVDNSLVLSRTSLMMRLGGVTLGAFILFHLAHLTWGWICPGEYVAGDPYNNVIAGFQHSWLAAFYLLAMVPLCLHLYHGIWSAFQTLGLNSPRYNALRRPLALAFSLLVFVGNASIPLAVQAGVLHL